MKNAFTLVELLIVLAIAGVLVTSSFGVYATLRHQSNLEVVAQEMQSVFSNARDRTLASDGEQTFGIYIDTSNQEYFLFPGSSYSSGNSQNEKYTIPANVTVLTPEFEGGGSEIVFNRLVGSTLQFGEVSLEDASDSSRIMTICINPDGIIDLQFVAECEEDFIEYHSSTYDTDLTSPFPGRWGDIAQSFTTESDDIYVREAQLDLRRLTADPSDVYVEIRQDSTVGAVLGRSSRVDGASLPVSFDWVPFVFPVPPFLSANTQYFLRLRSLADSTVYDPDNPSFSATGTIHWGYEHSAIVPPAYSGGDAWHGIEYTGYGGAGAVGQQLGPADQYDFSFRLLHGIDPPSNVDSRHLEFELDDPVNINHDGWSIKGYVTLTLTFEDPGNPDIVENIVMADYFNSPQDKFDWEGSVDVYGDTEILRIHSLYIDDYDTVLSIHRDRGINSKAVTIDIDGREIVSYAADGTPTAGGYGGEVVYR